MNHLTNILSIAGTVLAAAAWVLAISYTLFYALNEDPPIERYPIMGRVAMFVLFALILSTGIHIIGIFAPK